MMLKNKPLNGVQIKICCGGFRRQNIGRIGDLLKFQIKCKFRDGTDSFTGPYLIDLLTAIKVEPQESFPDQQNNTTVTGF